MSRMTTISASLIATLAACSTQAGALKESSRSAQLGETDPDAGVDAAPDAAPAAPVDCGSLCLVGDRLEETLVDPAQPWTAYRQETVAQSLEVDSAGGTLEVTLRLTGNFGTVDAADGVTVSIGDSDPCLPDVRVAGQLGVNECRVTVTVAPGHASVPVLLRQWNGASEGWAVISETVALVLQ